MLVATFAAIQYTASFGAVPLCPYQFGTGVLLGKPPCWDEPGEDRLNCLTSLPPPPPHPSFTSVSLRTQLQGMGIL